MLKRKLKIDQVVEIDVNNILGVGGEALVHVHVFQKNGLDFPKTPFFIGRSKLLYKI